MLYFDLSFGNTLPLVANCEGKFRIILFFWSSVDFIYYVSTACEDVFHLLLSHRCKFYGNSILDYQNQDCERETISAGHYCL